MCGNHRILLISWCLYSSGENLLTVWLIVDSYRASVLVTLSVIGYRGRNGTTPSEYITFFSYCDFCMNSRISHFQRIENINKRTTSKIILFAIHRAKNEPLCHVIYLFHLHPSNRGSEARGYLGFFYPALPLNTSTKNLFIRLGYCHIVNPHLYLHLQQPRT